MVSNPKILRKIKGFISQLFGKFGAKEQIFLPSVAFTRFLRFLKLNITIKWGKVHPDVTGNELAKSPAYSAKPYHGLAMQMTKQISKCESLIFLLFKKFPCPLFLLFSIFIQVFIQGI